MYTQPINYSTVYPTLDTLPEEVISRIIKYINMSELGNLGTASKRLSSITIHSIHRYRLNELRNYIDQLVEALNDSSRSKAEIFLSIKRSIEYYFPNLIELKQHILSIKHQLINVLVTLRDLELMQLAKISCPYLCENIWITTNLRKKIALAFASRDILRQLHSFREISKVAIEIGELRYILDLAKKTHDPSGGFAIKRFLQTLLEFNQTEDALNLALNIQDASIQSFALRDIANYLAQADQIEMAIEIALRIPMRYEKSFALRDLSKSHNLKKKLLKAKECASFIPVESERKLAFDDLLHSDNKN